MSDPMPAARRGNMVLLPQTPLTPQLTRMSSVVKTRIEWIAPGRLAVGKLTMMDGDPGLGKSTMALEWAALMSRGEPILGGPKTDPRGVVLISDEDDLGDTTVPRLEAAGADLSRICQLHMIDDEGNESLPEFPRDGPALEAAMREFDAGLLIIDPLVMYLGPEINSHRDADVRRAVMPIVAAAQKTRAAVLTLRHMNKSGGTNAIYRGGGSIGFLAIARIGMVVAKDPDDESGQTAVLATSKINVGLKPPSIAYQLESVPGTDVARVRWIGESRHQADHLLEPAATDEERGQRSEAEDFLISSLTDGSMEVRDLQRQAKDAAIAWRTIERAKSKLGIESRREGFGRNGKFLWFFPEHIERQHKSMTAIVKHIDRQDKKPMNQGVFPLDAIDRHAVGVYVCDGCNLPRSRDNDPCPNCGSAKGHEIETA